MEENRRPRFRFRLGTLLLIVAVLALLLVVVIQQVRIERMRQLIDAHAKQQDQMTTMMRELRDHLERPR